MEKPKIEKELKIRNLFNSLAKAFGSINREERSKVFLELILSPTEKERIAKRVAILKELRRGSSYEEIKKNLDVSDNTIAQMSNALRQAPSQALRIIDELIKQELIEKGEELRFN